MKFLIILIFIPFLAISQSSDPIPPSGLEKFVDFLDANFPNKRTESEKNLTGEILLELRISENGKVDSVDIIKNVGVNGAMDLIKIINLAGDWTPGKENGKVISKWVKLPYLVRSAIGSNSIISAKPVLSGAEFDQEFYNNFKYPEKALTAGIKGTYVLSFDIKENGSPTNIKLLEDPGYEIADAAIRALRRAGKWTPAKDANGNYINAKTTYQFKLDIKEFRRGVR